jgi:MJ1316 RNA cyclic group end recognition domain
MVPIQSLLQRICWDKEFGGAEFTIGYYDRARHCIVTLPFERIHLEPGSHFSASAVIDWPHLPPTMNLLALCRGNGQPSKGNEGS